MAQQNINKKNYVLDWKLLGEKGVHSVSVPCIDIQMQYGWQKCKYESDPL